MLVERLVYGCDRLGIATGRRAAEDLLRLCLAAGVRRFDTAPSYGLGLAEGVVGDVLRGRDDVRITVKAGLPRTRWGTAKNVVRRLQTIAGRMPPPVAFAPSREPGRLAGAHFAMTTLEASLRASLAALRIERADLLLLHETPADPAVTDALAFLTAQREGGRATQVGYSHAAAFDDATAAAYPADFAAQVAIPPEWLLGAARPPARLLLLHSVLKTGRYLQQTDPDFARGLARAADLIATNDVDRGSAEAAATLAIARILLPDCALIFTSADRDRLKAILTAVDFIDRRLGCEPIARALARTPGVA